jgi:LPXTG-site transpeptidase (sortase) family protein
MKQQVEETKNWILSSVEASKITTVTEKTETEITDEIIKEEKTDWNLSIKKYKKELDSNTINLNIEITTLENRIIIPRIGKNVPLIDVKNRTISWQNELNDIFMDELKNGVVRYPGSAKPGDIWTTFIFWHSSNFPWMKWDYNDVFATLDNIVYWDEIIVYYEQKKYTYIIREKHVITPGDVSVLKRKKGINEISIMTCWPIWTTLNRLIVTWELVED